MPIIAVANRKGGVGKTTISVALATHLARRHKVLLVDLDSQASATELLNVEPQPAVAEWLILEKVPELVQAHGLALLASNVITEKANTSLATDADVTAIERGLPRLGRFDYVLLDCPPSLNILTRAAIYASDYVLAPTLAEYLSVAGVRQLLTQTAQMRERWGLPVKLLGIQPNMYRRTTTEHHENLTALVKAYGAYPHNGGRVWPPLRQSIAVSRASAEGVTVWDTLSGQVLAEWEAMVERVESYA